MGGLADQLAGRFIVVDGPDGAGKSTQVERLAGWLEAAGVPVVVTRDPGGTAIGERVREILLDVGAGEMGVECEMMLYMASRAQLVAEVVRPALAAGKCVLCDRFVSATVAYQGAGGADTHDILTVARAAIGDTWPDLTVILDIDAEAGLARTGGDPDRMEAKNAEFHRRVRSAFLQQTEARPERFAVVDARGKPEEVTERLCQALRDRWV